MEQYSTSVTRPDFTEGCYQTNWGFMHLCVQDDIVVGTFNYYGRNYVVGKLQDNILAGVWVRPAKNQSPAQSGIFEFAFAENSRSFNGVWGDKGQNPSGLWNGVKIACPRKLAAVTKKPALGGPGVPKISLSEDELGQPKSYPLGEIPPSSTSQTFYEQMNMTPIPTPANDSQTPPPNRKEKKRPEDRLMEFMGGDPVFKQQRERLASERKQNSAILRQNRKLLQQDLKIREFLEERLTDILNNRPIGQDIPTEEQAYVESELGKVNRLIKEREKNIKESREKILDLNRALKK